MKKNEIKYFSDLPTQIFFNTLPETDIHFILALYVFCVIYHVNRQSIVCLSRLSKGYELKNIVWGMSQILDVLNLGQGNKHLKSYKKTKNLLIIKIYDMTSIDQSHLMFKLNNEKMCHLVQSKKKVCHMVP